MSDSRAIASAPPSAAPPSAAPSSAAPAAPAAAASPASPITRPTPGAPASAPAFSLDRLRTTRGASRNAALRLVGCHATTPAALARRLGLLGLRPGAELRVLQGPDARGAVLAVGTARLALSLDLVRQLQVAAL